MVPCKKHFAAAPRLSAVAPSGLLYFLSCLLLLLLLLAFGLLLLMLSLLFVGLGLLLLLFLLLLLLALSLLLLMLSLLFIGLSLFFLLLLLLFLLAFGFLLGLCFVLLLLGLSRGLLFRRAGFFVLLLRFILACVTGNGNSQKQERGNGADHSNCFHFGISGIAYACARENSGAYFRRSLASVRESQPSTQPFIAAWLGSDAYVREGVK